LEIKEKTSKRDLLTKADLESQKIIVETLTKLMVTNGISEDEIGFICEEDFSKNGKHTFIIDPLDGTSSFVEQSDSFTISIAYKNEDEIVAGVIYFPIKNIVYFAQKDKGAYKIEDEQKIQLQITEKKLSDSLLCFNTSTNTETTQKILRRIINIVPFVYRVRENPCISFNLMRMAENHYQIVINSRAKLWDIAAAKLIIEQAGAIMVNWQGQRFDFDFTDRSICYPMITCFPNAAIEIVKHFHE
jgi:myo-inositol-1(or 4)-monophosphatase